MSGTKQRAAGGPRLKLAAGLVRTMAAATPNIVGSKPCMGNELGSLMARRGLGGSRAQGHTQTPTVDKNSCVFFLLDLYGKQQ